MPMNTDAAMSAAVRPNRMPLIAGVVVAAVLVAGGAWFLKGGSSREELVPPPPPSKPDVPIVPPPVAIVEAATADAGMAAMPPQLPKLLVKKSAALFSDGDKMFARAGTDDGLKVGVELKVVGAAGTDGWSALLGAATVLEVFPKMARLSLDAAASRAGGDRSVVLIDSAVPVADVKKPAPGVKVALNATMNLVQDPKRAVRLKNTGSFKLTRCSVVIPGQRQADFTSLLPGMSREIVLDNFSDNPSAPSLTNEVRLNCAQGSITLPAN